MANQILGVGGKQLGSAEIPAVDLAARAVVLGNLRHLRLPVDAIPLGEINALAFAVPQLDCLTDKELNARS